MRKGRLGRYRSPGGAIKGRIAHNEISIKHTKTRTSSAGERDARRARNRDVKVSGSNYGDYAIGFRNYCPMVFVAKQQTSPAVHCRTATEEAAQ